MYKYQIIGGDIFQNYDIHYTDFLIIAIIYVIIFLNAGYKSIRLEKRDNGGFLEVVKSLWYNKNRKEILVK